MYINGSIGRNRDVQGTQEVECFLGPSIYVFIYTIICTYRILYSSRPPHSGTKGLEFVQEILGYRLIIIESIASEILIL